MQFQVPQFIEVEDKVFGPLTFRQFLYLAGGAGFSFILYVYLPIYISFLLIIAIIVFTLTLTFYKYNGRDFIFLTESVFKYGIAKKLYLWKKVERPTFTQKAPATQTTDGLDLPRLSESRLKELSWSLDINDNTKPPQEENES
ncbi:MAG: PrgI family protein [Candidatus Vogelbacteria bacterium]|nr:PrgI family protein [Candidatus Vogelbacteria bacterium]